MRKLLLGQLHGLYKQLPLPAVLLISLLMVCLACLCAVCQPSAGQTSEANAGQTSGQFLDEALVREMEARAVLAQGEKLLWMARPLDAIPILESVEASYPGTEAALYAVLRRAQALSFADMPVESIAVARGLASSHPDEMAGRWARCCLGQSLASMGKVSEGIAELRKMSPMPDKCTDYGPLNEAREVMARLCCEHLRSKWEDISAASGFLGMDQTKAADRAEIYASIAVHWARQGDSSSSDTAFNKLKAECPGQMAEIRWAAIHRALFGLKTDKEKGLRTSPNAALLMSLIDEAPADDQQAAVAALEVARYQMWCGNTPDAIKTLQAASKKFPGTANAAEIYYELGVPLYASGKCAEAVDLMTRIRSDYPLSSYAVPASFYMIERPPADGFESMQNLVKQAIERYGRKWETLAYCPTQKDIENPNLLAMQCAALAAIDRSHETCQVLDNLASRFEAPEADVSLAKAELAFYSLKTAAESGKFSWEAGYVLSLVVNHSEASDSQMQNSVINRSADIVVPLMDSKPPEQQANAWYWLGKMYMGVERYAESVDAYRNQLRTGTGSDELRARTIYRVGMCYYEHLGNTELAKDYMQWLVDDYPDNQWAKKARGALYVWSNYGTRTD